MCKIAKDEKGLKFIVSLAKLIGKPVTAYDQVYEIYPAGNKHVAIPQIESDGSINKIIVHTTWTGKISVTDKAWYYKPLLPFQAAAYGLESLLGIH